MLWNQASVLLCVSKHVNSILIINREFAGLEVGLGLLTVQKFDNVQCYLAVHYVH